MQSLRNTKLPSAGVIAGAVQAIVYGGGATYGLYNSLFNVEGGHRAIVYNRVVGVKDKVRARSSDPARDSRAVPAGPTARASRADARASIPPRETRPRRRTPRRISKRPVPEISRNRARANCRDSVPTLTPPPPRDPPRVPLLPSPQIYSEGTHLMVPWFERPVTYDVRARAHQVTSNSGSRDLQMVNISLRVLTRPDASKLPEIYRTLGTDFNERVLPSIIHETLKSVVAQYNASQLITQREQVSAAVRATLIKRAAHFNMILDDVSITALTFGREYTAAIEAKQVAQQEAERAKFIVEKAVQDKRSAVIKAEGEAKSAKLIGEAIASNPAFITLRRIEAARDIAQTMSESNNRVMLNADSLLLNLAEIGTGAKK